MKDLVFLPDRDGTDELSSATGLVRCGRDASALSALAQRLTAPVQAKPADDLAAWRGALALALVADAWPEATSRIRVLEITPDTSLFASWVLSARSGGQGSECVRLVLLEKDGQRALLGTVHPQKGLTLPAAAADLSALLPARCTWYDAGLRAFTDPTYLLTEQERALLLRRIRRMGLAAPQVAAFVSDLGQAEWQEAQPIRQGDEEALAALGIRMQAVCGMTDADDLTVTTLPYALTDCNPLVGCFTEQDAQLDDGLEACSVYAWHGVPFARASSFCGLIGTGHPQEAQALEAIAAETALLTEHAIAWNRRLGEQLNAWLDARSGSRTLLSAAREKITQVRDEAIRSSRQVRTTITLTWPWNAGTGAVSILLGEALGDRWMTAAARPFADRLTRVTGFSLGDTALNTCCSSEDGVLLPPLSRDMAACVFRSGDGEGLALDAMRFEPEEDGSITASFLLRGEGEVRMVRTYASEEICALDHETAPRIAVWPGVPMACWQAYHVFLRQGETQIAVLRDGQWTNYPGHHADWVCLPSGEYPACLLVTQGDVCLGAIPNALPPMRLSAQHDAVVSIDLGASATAAVITLAGQSRLVKGQPLTRMLLSPAQAETDEFLLSLAQEGVTPTAVALTGDGDEVFRDGYVLRSADFEALTQRDPFGLKTALKWRADDASVRARRILLHQVMLGAVLDAVQSGAKSIAWRVSIADEMGEGGREAMLKQVEELAQTVAAETGLPLNPALPAVTWTSEANALYAYLRTEGGIRGSVAALDIGAGSTKMHLWLQGQSRAAAGAVVLQGAQSQLFAALRERPDIMLEDFSDCPDEALSHAAVNLCAQIRALAVTPQYMDKALLMLDQLLVDFRPQIISHMQSRVNEQRPMYLHAVLLEMLAAAFFTAGLMLDQAGADPMINHRLPDELTMCLTGRGMWLLDAFVQLPSSLQSVMRAAMSPGHPVRTVSLWPDRLPAGAVATGLACARELEDASAPAPVRSRVSFARLMHDMVRAMCAAWPMHEWLLHPGLIDMWGELTPAGEDTIRRAAAASYGDGEDIPGAVMAFIKRMRVTPVEVSPLVSPGE